ncbi:type IV pilin N-terminal domain-containing protein [Methanoculleus sp. UBA303]|jgi:flagellin-like protein|uniref:type IV pilin N-terminal domain-containing protein n=1 Tax=Methanoculleus sp. UBA303 TaxID=1915497 RepID=UPI0025FBEF81|nr:type IV pilin N-terminal domain-containing protein [Methanoculleus sp. UBA303]
MNFRENEDAVSPVIGVILMVAITVILAAVIAAFVFGMGSNIGTTKTVAVTAGQNGDNVVLTYHGGADAATLEYLKATVTENGGSQVVTYIYSDNSETAATKNTLSDVRSAEKKDFPIGVSISLSGGSPKQDHVVVTGYFKDGSEHVVLDTYV